MKHEVRDGPKRLRWTRRDWSGCHGLGQSRRWDSGDGKFKTEREARRAGLTGKVTKHREQPGTRGVIVYGEPTLIIEYLIIQSILAPSDARRVYATTDVREAHRDSLADQTGLEEEEEPETER